MSRIHVLHENTEWIEPLRDAFLRRGLPWNEWFLHEGSLDLATSPPEGVFYNRMSASSHTRGHRYGPEYAAAVLAWLEGYGRRVINNSRALALEVSKAAQYAALEMHGVPTPRTIAAIGAEAIIDAADGFAGPIILKHNRAGKGLGVRLFAKPGGVRDYVSGPAFEPSIDGITLVQDFIEAPEPHITRMEFIGGRLAYAVRVDTSQGFELCPADACRTGADPRPLFDVVDGFNHPLVEPVGQFLASNGIQVAGVEFIVDRDGEPYVYDVNTNTNYNPEAEALAGVSGMGALAAYLGEQLAAEIAAREAA